MNWNVCMKAADETVEQSLEGEVRLIALCVWFHSKEEEEQTDPKIRWQEDEEQDCSHKITREGKQDLWGLSWHTEAKDPKQHSLLKGTKANPQQHLIASPGCTCLSASEHMDTIMWMGKKNLGDFVN